MQALLGIWVLIGCVQVGWQAWHEFGDGRAFVRPQPDQLRLTGRLKGQAATISLERVDLNSFTLRNRGFNWVQEYPYFR